MCICAKETCQIGSYMHRHAFPLPEMKLKALQHVTGVFKTSVLAFSKHNQICILEVKVLFETPKVWPSKKTQNKISNLISLLERVQEILFVVVGSARQKVTEDKLGPERKEAAGGWSDLRNVYSYRSINLHVTRACLLKISYGVLVAESDVKGRIRCEDINVGPN